MEGTALKKRILIIEDEKKIAQVIEVNLLMAGYLCDKAFDGKEGLRAALENDYDLILLDIMLPELDGFSVCRGIRMKKSTPIIMVTAKEEDADKVFGLDLGADDYVTKPFAVKVLLSRINANIRRYSGELAEIRASSTGETPPDGKIVIRELVIDRKNYRVSKAGREIELSKKEYELLLFLALNPNQLFSREELLEKVWGYGGFLGDVRTVDVTMFRLRSKIEASPSEPEYILTRRSKGYYIPL